MSKIVNNSKNLQKVREKVKKIGNFKITKETNFWIYLISELNWTDLCKNYSKDIFLISSYEIKNVKKGDIILIFQKPSINVKLHGFVSICQIGSDLKENKENKKIFRDINMNRFFCKIDMLENFSVPHKISQLATFIKKKCNNFTTANGFSIKYTSDKCERAIFYILPKDIAFGIVEVLINLTDEKSESEKSENIKHNSIKNNYNNSDADISSDSSDSSDGDISSDNSDSDSDIDSDIDSDDSYCKSDNDDVRVVHGHIPILMIPCSDFNWSKSNEMTIKNFKTHFFNCAKCDKTDNNNCSFAVFFNKNEKRCKIHCEEIIDDDQIDEKLENYYNLTLQKYELTGKSRKYEHIYLYRFVSRSHVYHRSILIMW